MAYYHPYVQQTIWVLVTAHLGNICVRALFIQYSTGHSSVYNADEVPSVFKMAHEMILPQLGMCNPHIHFLP